MRALLIANSGEADAGFVGERFRHHGFTFTECLREQPGEWPDLDGFDLVVLLGSEWSVYWSHVADQVAAEAALVRVAQARGVPQFGICYGNQIMAHALGGAVERATTPEIGWYDIVSDVPAGIAAGPWFEWHSDVVTVPPGAHELARTTVGPQAWRLGRSVCTQFHPEVDEAVVTRWTRGRGGKEVEAFGAVVEQLLDETRRNVAVSREHTGRLVDWFLSGPAVSEP